ncbi:unnamed protein product [Gemmata massiliana]|uniref:Uncharacterized protein n=1 Tax=Gemmata massiliana TaxID=1210884 RepID=A0A6P2D0D2_9BACT|nr:hypothetical protein [Gemmata massiliana]VTR92882.1 unnamed protein product [Gemmata massiliana]
MPHGLDALREDVAASSAAHLFNVLPEILKLKPSEQYERFKQHIETAIVACLEFRQWSPSDN